MAVKAGDLELELIDGLSECVAERLPNEPVDSYAEFVRQYYRWVPAEDLADRSEIDLYGAAIAEWNLALHRQPGEAKVHVYNPEFEQCGWSSPHSVVEIVSDDMPFLVDSVTMELNRQGYGIELIVHPVIRVVRDADGELTEVLEPGAEADGHPGRVGDPRRGRARDRPRPAWPCACAAGRRAGARGGPGRGRGLGGDARPGDGAGDRAAADEPPPLGRHDVERGEAFLQWLADDHFTFLGYREYELDERDGDARLTAVPGTGLGILRGTSAAPSTKLSPKALALARSPHALVLTKANSRATVHRPAYMDYVGVRKRFDARRHGDRRAAVPRPVHDRRLQGEPARDPAAAREGRAGAGSRPAFPPHSHDAKGMIDILESLPRDLLVQISTDELFEMAIGILGLGERQRVRLFVARDQLDRFVACTLCLPRDRFNTVNRRRAAAIIAEAFGGGQLDWSLQLSESVLVRVNYIVRCPGRDPGRLRRGGDRGADHRGDARLER